MSESGVLLGVGLAILVIAGIVQGYGETRASAEKKGHGPAASKAIGIANVAMIVGGIMFFVFLPQISQRIGLPWALLLILLFLVSGWTLLGRWFDKKPKPGEEK